MGLAKMGHQQGLGLKAWLHTQAQQGSCQDCSVTGWGNPSLPTNLAFQLST